MRLTVLGITLNIIIFSMLITASADASEHKSKQALSQTNIPKHISNSIGMQFVRIDAGAFFMGSCKIAPKAVDGEVTAVLCPSQEQNSPDAADNETSQHYVTISQPFYMAKYEVSYQQFYQYVLEAQRSDIFTARFLFHNNNGDRAAINYVSWQDAMGFIDWLNKREKCSCYRLPTEAEWEYVARESGVLKQNQSKMPIANYAWYKENSNYKVHEVGSKLANALDVHDMLGNVDEWVQDWYQPSYGIEDATDPTGPYKGYGKVIRGGSIFDSEVQLRPTRRSVAATSYKRGGLGFRVVRTIQPRAEYD